MVVTLTPEQNEKYILNYKTMALKSFLMEITLG
jgi:hypothetical protein